MVVYLMDNFQVSSHAAARSNSRRQGYSLRRHRTKPVQFKSHTPQKVRDSSRSGVKRARDEPINFRRRHRRRRHYDSSSSSDSCQASSSDEGGGTWKEVKGRIKPLNSEYIAVLSKNTFLICIRLQVGQGMSPLWACRRCVVNLCYPVS